LLSGFGYGIYDLLGGTAYDNAIASWNNKDYFNAAIWTINGVGQECLTLLTFGEWGAATKAGTIGTTAIGSTVKTGTKAVSNGLNRGMKVDLQFFGKNAIRTEPANLMEQMVMNAARNGAGKEIMAGTKWRDPLYEAVGWTKMQYTVTSANGQKVTVHYMENILTGIRTGFKFK
jgi:hypothetical protein